MGESFDHPPPGWIRQSSKCCTQLIHNYMVVDCLSMSSVNFAIPDFCSLISDLSGGRARRVEALASEAGGMQIASGTCSGRITRDWSFTVRSCETDINPLPPAGSKFCRRT